MTFPNPSTRAWLVLGLLLAPFPAAARRYTLPELLEHVSRVYPGVVAAREGQAAAQAQLEQAGRLWAPQGEITFGLTGSPDVKCADATGFSNTTDKAARQANCITTTATDLRGQNLGNVLPLHGVVLQLNARL